METEEIKELKKRVPCAAVLEKADFAVGAKESTRQSIKYRRGNDIIIVIHGGMGWFDPQSEVDAKSDVFTLIRHIHRVGFSEALAHAAELVGFVPTEPVWLRKPRERASDIAIPDRWRVRRKPWPGSATWRYPRDEGMLPDAVLRAAIRQDRLREGPVRQHVGGPCRWPWRRHRLGGARSPVARFFDRRREGVVSDRRP